MIRNEGIGLDTVGLRVQHADIQDLNEAILAAIYAGDPAEVRTRYSVSKEVLDCLRTASPCAVGAIIACGVPIAYLNRRVAADLCDEAPSQWRMPRNQCDVNAETVEANARALLLLQRVAAANATRAGMLFSITTEVAECVLHTRMGVIREYASKVPDILRLREGREHRWWSKATVGGKVNDGRGERFCQSLAMMSMDTPRHRLGVAV